MLDFLRDKLTTLRLQAKYERRMREQLLALSESAVPEDQDGRWHPIGELSAAISDGERQDLRTQARTLAAQNPHARNILRLLESYVTGAGLQLVHQWRTGVANDDDHLVTTADRMWSDFLTANVTHYSFNEHARRAWRDGECFVRRYADHQWPPAVRFVDPELIGSCPDFPQSQGVLTDPDDVETPLEYLRIDGSQGNLAERISASEMLHTRVGVDSNQKRGVTILAPVVGTLDCYQKWIDTELHARKLQASIVLWRKVQGSPQQTYAAADTLGTPNAAGQRSERFKPGTILTTNQATEIKFLQPETNFGDAVPLGRMLLLGVAAGVGLPEFMLTSDASNANYASTMVAEGPAVKLFQSEQQFFAREFTRLWRWVMEVAIELGYLPENLFDRIEPCWTFPQLVTRDRPRERAADAQLVELGILSRAEVARRDGVEPQRMRTEVGEESTLANKEKTV